MYTSWSEHSRIFKKKNNKCDAYKERREYSFSVHLFCHDLTLTMEAQPYTNEAYKTKTLNL